MNEGAKKILQLSAENEEPDYVRSVDQLHIAPSSQTFSTIVINMHEHIVYLLYVTVTNPFIVPS